MIVHLFIPDGNTFFVIRYMQWQKLISHACEISTPSHVQRFLMCLWLFCSLCLTFCKVLNKPRISFPYFVIRNLTFRASGDRYRTSVHVKPYFVASFKIWRSAKELKFYSIFIPCVSIFLRTSLILHLQLIFDTMKNVFMRYIKHYNIVHFLYLKSRTLLSDTQCHVQDIFYTFFCLSIL